MKLMIVLFLCTLISTTKWHTNLEEGIQEVKKTDKNILLVFSGSDWCKPCIQLKENVFQSEAFKSIASKKFALVNIDFKRDQKSTSKDIIRYNESIAEKYNPNGFFPYVLILNQQGKVIKSIEGYKGETSNYFIDSYLK